MLNSPFYYFFELGRDLDCAVAELATVLGAQADLADWANHLVIVTSQHPLNLLALQHELGGVVRAGQIFAHQPSASRSDVEALLTTHLQQLSSRAFGISLAGGTARPTERNKLGLAIKQARRQAGQSLRFIAADQPILKSVVAHDQLLRTGAELFVITTATQVYFGQTSTVQDWRRWSLVDFGRPARDPRRGMLPPKLARLLVNLAGATPATTLLDPFCGVGTVLQEALRTGIRTVIGTDTDPAAVTAAQRNLDWLASHVDGLTGVAIRLEITDVHHYPSRGLPIPDVIVCEGPLGASTLNRMQPDHRLHDMARLFRAYRDWLPALSRTGATRVVLAYPQLRDPVMTLPIAELSTAAGWQLDQLTATSAWAKHPVWQAGHGSVITYARPDQIVGRQIVRLTRQSTS